MATDIVNFPRREDYTRIATAIESQNDLLRNHFKAAGESVVRSWEGFRNLCRAGGVRTYYGVGDQLQCKKGDTTLTWDIVHIGDVAETGGNYVILQTHDCLPMDTMEFDSREAIFRTKSELPAGTYHFTTSTAGITDPNWTDPSKSDWAKTWQFTTTKAVPVGGQVCFAKDMDWTTSLAPLGIATYSKPTDTTALETVTLAEGTNGTDLATLGTINHAQRICYGYNRWSQSGLRQWLNSDKAAGSWWSPQNDFDRPNTYQSIAGFMNGLDSDFLAVVSKSRVTSGINKTIENGAPETVRDKFFIPTRTNINGIDTYISDSSDGAIVWDYYTKFRADEKTGTSNDSDQNRVKTNGSTSAALPWKLRTILPNNVGILLYASREGACNTTGRACGLDCVAPACRIE